MAFWVLNKQTGEPKVFGSLPLVSEYTGIKYRALLSVFSERKRTELDNIDFRICKVEFIRGGKKSAMQ